MKLTPSSVSFVLLQHPFRNASEMVISLNVFVIPNCYAESFRRRKMLLPLVLEPKRVLNVFDHISGMIDEKMRFLLGFRHFDEGDNISILFHSLAINDCSV
ncbi:hypothetical protein TNCV_5060391 [Trichonephila clavipes]|nr:hypothetical protein TNCV_5060391 [Trichonephila clavipes]